MKPAGPQSLYRWLRQHFGWQWFRGDYADWASARAASSGYDDAAVLTRVLAATRAVQAGRALWERDGVAFKEPVVETPLLAVLRQAAHESGGFLRVIDIGGALGSTWWQHRTALATIAQVQWCVVEQRHYIEAGREFADEKLSFHDSLSGALTSGRASVILLSSVLPYMESPMELLHEVATNGCRHVLIDRTPLIDADRTKLVVQHTPPTLGGGSYPCWLFARGPLLSSLTTNYRLVQEWVALDDLSPFVSHRGFHFQLREQ